MYRNTVDNQFCGAEIGKRIATAGTLVVKLQNNFLKERLKRALLLDFNYLIL